MKNIVANLYIPINTIITLEKEQLQKLGLPCPIYNDYKVINELRNSSGLMFNVINKDPKELLINTTTCLKKASSLSFYQFLLDKLLMEARVYAEGGIRCFLIENADAPYFDNEQPVIYWIIRALSLELKHICTDEFTLGIKLNKNLSHWSLDIACRNGYDFIYHDYGNIADLKLQRNILNKKHAKIYSQYDFNGQGVILHNDDFVNKKELTSLINIYDLNEVENYEVDYYIMNECFHFNHDKFSKIDVELLNKFMQNL